MARPLIILGTGGSAYDVLDIVEAVNRVRPAWHVAGFLDDARPAGHEHLGIPVLGRLADAAAFAASGHWFVSVIGSDRSYPARPDVIARTGLPPERFATLVHPGAGVSARAGMGPGTYVNFGASVAGGVTIGAQVSVGPGCIIGHNAVVEDYAMVAPGATVSGFARVGRNSYVGAAAAIRQQVTIGERALVGMGAVVLRDVEPGAVVVGNPARPLSRPAAAGAARPGINQHRT